MQYGAYELVLLSKNIILTKIFHHSARLIRYPCYIRNSKQIYFSKGFTCGYNCRFESIKHQDTYGKIIFGTNLRMGDFVHIASATSVQIGNNVLIASHVLISDLNHGTYNDKCSDNPDSYPCKRALSSHKITIGSDVWIGEGVAILEGASIGSGVVIGAHSVVTSSIPSNSIAVGSPAKIIKRYNKNSNKWERIYDEKL